MENEDEGCDNFMQLLQSTKKRKVTGRISDVRKKILSSTHELGEDCKCSRLKCFRNTTDEERRCIILNYNNMTVNEQNSYLAGLINVNSISQRRPRHPESEAKFRDNSYSYRVRVNRENSCTEINVCSKAFISMHGITKKKLEVIQRYLKKGVSPKDGRGQHSNRKHRVTTQALEAVRQHISSFKGERSHYSLKTSKKVYLPSELNITKMYELFKKSYPTQSVSYEKYRLVFNTEFNIGFGYPRMDTCSYCDRHAAEVRALEHTLKSHPESSSERVNVENKIKEMSTEQKIHLLKSDMFYIRKRESKAKSKASKERESITMDFQKNLPVPNITTNDVYYKRQLTLCMFNIHILSTDESYFYVYDETVAYKGCNEVASFLFHFVMTILDPSVRILDIFSDSCGGQNKNWTISRMIHYIVHHVKRLDQVKMTFPIRGHSYLECDRNMASINQKKWVEMPKDWVDEIESARAKPSPFHVVEVGKEIVRDWSGHLNQLYFKKCPFLSRPLRELVAEKQHPRFLKYRTSFHGHWDSHVVNQPSSVAIYQPQPQGEFFLPDCAYKGKCLFKPL